MAIETLSATAGLPAPGQPRTPYPHRGLLGLGLPDLLPAAVVCREAIGDDPTAHLLPAELPLIARTVDRRRREVIISRTCARRALQVLGFAALPLLRGEHGEPLWPAGVVGSITHTAGYCAAAVVLGSAVRSIGIDAEPDAPLPKGVLEHVAFGVERRPRHHPAGICWDRLLFSAKESVYKAWYPLTGRWLGFDDVVLEVDVVTSSFRATVLVDGTARLGPPLTELHGRFTRRGGLLLTAVTVPRA